MLPYFLISIIKDYFNTLVYYLNLKCNNKLQKNISNAK